MTVPSGGEIELETQDASGAQFDKDSTSADILKLDFERVNPVTGPIYVEGAKPGDVLQVELLQLDMSSFGWTGVIPGFGLLADQFPEPWLQTWEIEPHETWSRFTDGVQVPLQPMCGVIGVAPAEPGVHSVVPPRRVGGNMDIKQLGAGATLYLPVEVEGALLGIGDTHAAQGDGEVCGTGIESAMTVHCRVTVRRDLKVDLPQYEVRRPLERQSAAGAGYYVTTGIAPDLMEAVRAATERMIDHVGRAFNLDPLPAYALCSLVVDLKVSEVVDAPNWVVSAFLPLDIFRGRG